MVLAVKIVVCMTIRNGYQPSRLRDEAVYRIALAIIIIHYDHCNCSEIKTYLLFYYDSFSEKKLS